VTARILDTLVVNAQRTGTPTQPVAPARRRPQSAPRQADRLKTVLVITGNPWLRRIPPPGADLLCRNLTWARGELPALRQAVQLLEPLNPTDDEATAGRA
jgi:hypothetical protein